MIITVLLTILASLGGVVFYTVIFIAVRRALNVRWEKHSCWDDDEACIAAAFWPIAFMIIWPAVLLYRACVRLEAWLHKKSIAAPKKTKAVKVKKAKLPKARQVKP